MSRGIVLFALNNERVDYIKLAVICAGFIRKNMPGNPICIITDEASKWSYEYIGKSLSDVFDDIRIIDAHQQFTNRRTYRDTKYYNVDSTFRNETRSSVYSLSPYDETLLIDTDYLVCNDVLNSVWGSKEDVLINRDAVSLLHAPMGGKEFRLNPFGIRMYWATVIYFRKSKKAKLLFDLVDFIKENWSYYSMLYETPGTLFRNDYAFAIAIHILNGFDESGDFTKPLPIPSILTASDLDQFYQIDSHTRLRFFANDPDQKWKFYSTSLDSVNVHCMNKLSLLNHFDDIMEKLE